MFYPYQITSGKALVAAGLFMALLAMPRAAEANQEKVLYSFAGGADGDTPHGALIAFEGVRYGSTGRGGGSSACSTGCGTIYQIAGGQLSVLYAFAGGNDGSGPVGGLLADGDGNLYGTTINGGSDACILGCGTVFKVTPTGAKTTVYSFAGSTDGGKPSGGDLIADAAGNLYGTTQLGGGGNCSSGCGTVFKITPDGQESVLYAFQGPLSGDGSAPLGGLIADADGNLYGTTSNGGAGQGDCGIYGCGTVFKVTPDGQETVLHHFAKSDGSHAYGRLLADRAGNFYGVTSEGGFQDAGNVYQLTPNGTLNVLHTFRDNGKDGVSPFSSLIADDQGNLYGTTSYGGAHGDGTLFQITPAGEETVLYDFNSFSGDGVNPGGRLSRDKRGNLYGTTSRGGASGIGTFFKVKY